MDILQNHIELENYSFDSLEHYDNKMLEFLNHLNKDPDIQSSFDSLSYYLGRKNAYIVSKDNLKIGFFMVSNNPYNPCQYELYYAVEKKFRGKNFAIDFVKLICEYLEEMGITEFVIKPYSEGGKCVALKLGFEKEDNWYVRHKRKIK